MPSSLPFAGACTGAILAGGRATRFGGRPKGLERVGGRRILDRVADALRPVTGRLLLVTPDPAAADWLADARTVAEPEPGSGPMAGLHAALMHARGPVLVLAWDMPFVSRSLLTEILAAAEGVDAVVPESGSRTGVEPLCAWYSPACLDAISRELEGGDRRMSAFYPHIRLRRLPMSVVALHGRPEELFLSVNTPEDLARAEAIARAAG